MVITYWQKRGLIINIEEEEKIFYFSTKMGVLSHLWGTTPTPYAFYPYCLNCKNKLRNETYNDAVIQYLAMRKKLLMDGSYISYIFASFTRHIVVIWSYRYYMFDTQKLRMYIIIKIRYIKYKWYPW